MRNNSALLSVTGSDNITTCLMRPLIADTYVRQGRAIRLTLTYKVTIDKRNYIKSVGITVTSSSLSLHHVCLIYRYRTNHTSHASLSLHLFLCLRNITMSSHGCVAIRLSSVHCLAVQVQYIRHKSASALSLALVTQHLPSGRETKWAY